MRSLAMGAMAAMVLASAAPMAVAAHEEPQRERRKRQVNDVVSPERLERIKAQAEIERKSAQERMAKAEIKRLRKAEKLQRAADKGAIGSKVDTSDIPEMSAEQFATAKVQRKRAPRTKADPGPIKIEDKPKKSPRKTPGGTGGDKETTASKKPTKKPAAAPGKKPAMPDKKAPPFPPKKGTPKKK